MAYKPNIPQGNDAINVSAGDIRENFTQISNVLAVNHEDFNTPFAGMHKFLQMPIQGADPASGPNEGTLFTKVGDLSGFIELFFRRENNGAVVNITQSLGGNLATDPGYFYVGNVLVKWGTILGVAAPAGIYPLLFTVGGNIPVFSTPPIVFTQQISAAIDQTYILSGIATETGFTINKFTTPGTIDVPFFAIGT